MNSGFSNRSRSITSSKPLPRKKARMLSKWAWSDEERAEHEGFAESLLPAIEEGKRQLVELDSLKPPERQKSGRRTYGEEHFRRVAQVYAAAYTDASALRVSPTQTVADYFTRAWGEPVSYTQAAKWVARCREPGRGLLGPTRRGKAGGVLPSAKPNEEDSL